MKLVEVCRVVATSGLEEEEGLRRSEAAAKTTKNTACGTHIPSGWEGTDDLMIHCPHLMKDLQSDIAHTWILIDFLMNSVCYSNSFLPKLKHQPSLERR